MSIEQFDQLGEIRQRPGQAIDFMSKNSNEGAQPLSRARLAEFIRLVEQSHLPVRRTLGQIGIRDRRSIVGTISIRPAGQRRWTIAVPGLIGRGTVSR
jgi:hypothetical protein